MKGSSGFNYFSPADENMDDGIVAVLVWVIILAVVVGVCGGLF